MGGGAIVTTGFKKYFLIFLAFSSQISIAVYIRTFRVKGIVYSFKTLDWRDFQNRAQKLKNRRLRILKRKNEKSRGHVLRMAAKRKPEQLEPLTFFKMTVMAGGAKVAYARTQCPRN